MSTATKYDSERAYLERALEVVRKQHDEYQIRVDDLEDQIGYLETAIKALNVYEHVTPGE